MEGSDLTKPKSRKGKIAIIGLSIAVVLVIGSLVTLYLVGNNKLNDTKNNLNESKKQLADSEAQLKNVKAQLNASTQQIATLQQEIETLQKAADQAPQYFTFDDWGVKFLLPSGLTSAQVQYNTSSNTINFTTADVAALGGSCRISVANSIPLGSIVRTQNWDDAYSNDGWVSVNYLNGYYYFYKSPSGNCSSTNTSLQTRDSAKIRNLIFGIMVS